mmetsp:Transcript_47056/g.119222  ORF Transcript_47056/g.119222 Transcript_47056/m.119222 type:complete len:89 (+) Transcript_47056:2-268(+)
MRVREAILAFDFSDCMKLLQHYPPIPIEELLQDALRLRASDLIPAGASNRDVAARGVRHMVMAPGRSSGIAASSAQAWGGPISSWFRR